MSNELARAVAELAAETDFSGVVHVAERGTTVHQAAFGLADRAHGIPATLDTQFAMASGSKGFTAVVVLSLVGDGTLTLDTTARSVLGDALGLIEPDVTIDHLLTHTSGIGDYLDEEELDEDDLDPPLPVSVHRLATVPDFLLVVDGFPTKFPAGARFAYNNGGFIVLSLIAELAAGRSYHDLVAERVTGPAGMVDTAFLRSDELPGTAALGYVDRADGWRTNHFHLPVRGGGDGGAYTTLADMARFWDAVLGGRLLPDQVVDDMRRPHSPWSDDGVSYGRGIWIRNGGATIWLEGSDPGVSFHSAVDPEDGVLTTVISNTTDGAWPIRRRIDEIVRSVTA